MKADLLIYSGCKNPTWLLTNDEGHKLYEQLRVLPGTLLTWDRNDYLGYRGIEIGLDASENMRIFKGLVEIISGEEVRRFLDYNRELEIWIFATACHRIDDSIFNQLTMTEFER